MNRLSFLIQCLIFILLAGCSLPPKDIEGANISHQQFNTFSCEQLEIEMADLARQLEKKAVGLVSSQTAVGLVSSQTKEEEVEFAYLKGHYEAVAKAATRKRCAPY
ncbi:hypothetical protein N9Y18_06260 [Litoricolaceae bacterium]|nr:hypothetical protein [Litorivicinaceae bacterium]